MKNTNKIYAEVLYEIVKEKEDATSEILSFLKFLKEKGEIYKVDKIILEFEKIYNKKNNIFELDIKSANELSNEFVDKIAKSLGIEKYELKSEIDKGLLGGFIARYDDNLIDASIKNNLNKLHNKLKA